MASYYRDSSRDGFRVQVVVRGVRRKLWVGPVTVTGAKSIALHLDRLKIAAETATNPPSETIRWTAAVSPRIRRQLAAWGLIELGVSAESLPRTLGEYSQHYLDGRTDIAVSTRKRLTNSRRHMLLTWPESTALAAITPGDCDRFARAMRAKFKPSHAGKTIGDCRQIFAAAVRDRLITDNPWDGIDASQPHDRSREHYLTRSDAAKLITACEPYYAALVSLARFCGLRVPSEPLALQWSDIDWATGRMTVRAQKTNSVRVVPLLPECRRQLELLFELAPDGAVHVFNRARASAGTEWRAQISAAITRAGLAPWPKLFQNMRASARTDLESKFPDHVVNYWLGHSSRVGRQHYTRIHDEHYDSAVGQPVGQSPESAGQPVG